MEYNQDSLLFTVYLIHVLRGIYASSDGLHVF